MGPGTRALSSTRCLARSRTVSVRRPLTSRAGALGGHFAGPRDRGRDRHHELSARAGVRGALAPRARFELGRRSLSEVDPSLGQRRAPPAPAHSGSGARHHTGSANPDGRRLVEDDFAAATAALLNKLNLDGTIEHLVVVSAPARALPPRPERQDHRRAREGLQPASARGHRLTDRRRLARLWKRLPAQARPVISRANNSKLLTTTTALDQPEPNAGHRDRAADIHAVARLTPSAKDDNRKEKP